MKKRRNAISPAKAASASDGLDAAKARLAELETKADEGKALIAALIAATKVRALRFCSSSSSFS